MRKVNFSKIVVTMIAVIAVLVMAACGSDDNSKTVAESSTEPLKENESISDFVEMESEVKAVNDTESPNEVGTEAESKENSEESQEFQSLLVDLSAEEAIAIAEEGFRAMNEMSPEEMIKYTNIELLYYMGHAEEADDEKMLDEITALVNEMDEDYNSLGIVGHYAAMENVQLYDAQLISADEIDELNSMLSDGDLAMLGEIQDYQYNIENAYKLQMSYDGIEENQESYVLVVCANGQWELDVCLAVMRDTYRMIMQLK